jgi:hypothetical protein
LAGRVHGPSDLQMRVSLPSNWTVRVGSPSSKPLVAMDVKAGHRLEIAETQPTTFSLDQPVPRERLQQSIQTAQTAVPRGYVVEKAGQDSAVALVSPVGLVVAQAGGDAEIRATYQNRTGTLGIVVSGPEPPVGDADAKIR